MNPNVTRTLMSHGIYGTTCQLFISEEGFSVEFLGRNGIEYKEGENSMRVDTEMLMPPHGVSIYQQSIERWRRPFESVLLTAEHKNRTVNNIPG
jgi:hypothetical protein